MKNVALVGLGRIADVHYPGYIGNTDARILAVCDTNEETALKRKAEWNIPKHYTSFDDVLADPEIDAVEILTPTMLHCEMTIKALNAGKHVAVQKPMANTLAEADAMIEAAKKSGKILKVSDNYVFYPPTLLAKKLIDDGEIGTPTNIRIKLISGGNGGWEVPASAWAWRIKEGQEGRGLQTFDHGHHLWATAWFLLGDIERVVSWIDYIDGIVDSPAVIMWKHKDGMKYGMCEYAYGNEIEVPSKYYGNDEWIEITGSKGMVIINRCTGLLKDGPAVSLFTNGKWKHLNAPDDWVEGFKGSTQNFINSITGKEKPLLSAEEGRYILKFGIAIQKSNRLHREVYISELDSKVPLLVACFNRSKNILKKMPKKNLFDILGIGGNTEQYASKAKELTLELINKFDASAAPGWSTVMGLQITPEGGSPGMKFSMRVKDNKAELIEGQLPDDAVFTISIPAGTWAAVLLKKKKVEMALMQGKLKIQGKSEEALKLKAAFGL